MCNAFVLPVEGEAGRESGLMREEQDTHSLSGGNEDDAESNSPRYGAYLLRLEGGPGMIVLSYKYLPPRLYQRIKINL